ncbi:MAG: sporulation protein YqfD [Clostridia bacterium]|nr:sporulation protein YqfD [Clostridia bacterium]
MIKKMRIYNGEFVFYIKGYNRERLIETLKREGIALKSVKFYPDNRLKFTVGAFAYEKVFAIINKMCYNIISVRKKGFLRLINFITKNFGLIIGVLIFTVSSFYLSDFVLGMDFKGDAFTYSARISEYLNELGVKKYARFSSLDLQRLEDIALMENDYLSIISLKKRGQRIIVTAYLAKDNSKEDTEKLSSLLSKVDGVVKSVKAYRGTPLVSVGQTVTNGQVLIDGFVTVNDNTVSVLVYGEVVVETTKTYLYFTEKETDGEYFIALTMANTQIVGEYSFSKIKEISGFSYIVTVKYDITFIAN